ncbi:amidohydrolase [Salicibibacter cibi]|uniref:Amidohydrolase n=1 Tax=Salicibibacter cibi TaxID=2743001 RepID=A0A7T7CGF8_9BACI|nr:amidohydrolase [Salicibibacter cibi]QQK81140.1 amidohydrolase [Salicibibacter cibi]
MGTLWYNGIIRTMEHARARAEAVFTENGCIVDVGELQSLEKTYKPRILSNVDLQGATMFPGFVDSHAHMMGFGQNLLRLNLSSVTSSSQLLRALENEATTLEDREWLIGEGWNENNFSDQHMIRKKELDERFPERPVMLTRICRHAMIVNSKALQLAGLDRSTPDPSGGVIAKDERGELTGLLLDEAQDFIQRVAPAPTEPALEKALTVAFDHMIQTGLTGVHTEDLAYYGSFSRVLGAYRKTFADGSLGSHSAWLLEPYTDEPKNNGVAIYSPEALKAVVKRIRKKEMTVAVHVIGDAALAHTLDAIETYPPPEGKKDRLIHVQIANKSLIRRMQQLAVVLDLQPRFAVSDFPWVKKLLGRERLSYSYAWKTLLQHGLACAGGSDAPIEPPAPLLGLHAAMTRRKPEETHAGFLPDEKLSAFEAVQLYTQGSAKASGNDAHYGWIIPGYRADFTVLDGDPLSMEDPDELLQMKALYTIVDESIMYEHETV